MIGIGGAPLVRSEFWSSRQALVQSARAMPLRAAPDRGPRGRKARTASEEGGMARVAGKVALVAGSGGGIGGAGAEALAREGAAVYCTDLDGAAAEATAQRIRAVGGRAAGAALDLRDRAAVDAAIAATVREFGRLDIVLESAGISHRRNFLDLDAETWDRIIAVNLTGMFHLGQAAARQMVGQGGGGSIINVTSQLAEVTRPERAAYVASKGGARSLTQSMAIDLAAHGIRVNAIAPGPTLTGLTRASYADTEARRATEALIPLGRLGEPEDLVGAVLYLAADESRWVTGSTVTVDGGYLAI
jgi:NAD(P)-dependent dehydrogenase (short-subunit alcohol dehydrogenase family)